MTKDYMKIDEAAEYLSVCAMTMRRWVAQGIIPHVQITPSCIRIKRDDIHKCLSERTFTGKDGMYKVPEKIVEAHTGGNLDG